MGYTIANNVATHSNLQSNPKHILFLECDIQTKLTPLLHKHEIMVTNAHALSRFAANLKLPFVTSVHNEKAFGPTMASLKELLLARSCTPRHRQRVAQGAVLDV